MIQTLTQTETKIVYFSFQKLVREKNDYLLPKVVEQHDVHIHIIQIIAVRGILLTGPEVRVKALVREHVATVFGFIINTVKASHLVGEEIQRNQCFQEANFNITYSCSRTCLYKASTPFSSFPSLCQQSCCSALLPYHADSRNNVSS